MELYMNQNTLPKDRKVVLKFIEITDYDEFMSSDKDGVIFLTEHDWIKNGIFHQKIVPETTWIHKHKYYELNDSVFEPTTIDRDNFKRSQYKFYKIVIVSEE